MEGSISIQSINSGIQIALHCFRYYVIIAVTEVWLHYEECVVIETIHVQTYWFPYLETYVLQYIERNRKMVWILSFKGNHLWE